MIGKMFRLARSAAGSFAYYGTEHRVPALYYMNYSFLSMLVAAIAAASLMLILLPVLRGRRATIALSSIMMFTAVAQGYALIIPEWLVASTQLHDVPLTYWPGAPIYECSLWLGVGLQSANVTLICDSGSAHPYYNEHLHLDAQEDALRTSMLPPLQTAAFAIRGENGLYLRRAGQWAFACMCAAGATWLWTVSLILAVPAASGRAMRHLGLALLGAPALYHLLQRPSVSAALPGGRSSVLHLRYGASFWLCFSAGVGASLVGAALDVLAQRGVVFSTACQMESYEGEAGLKDFIDMENLDADAGAHISAVPVFKDIK